MAPRRCTSRCILCGSAAAILGLTSSGFAVENLWTGSIGINWNDPGNWSLGRVPTNANGQPTGDPFDDAVINTLTSFPVITVDLAATPRDIVVGSGTGANGRVDHLSGTAATGGGNWMFVGREGGTGTYNLANTAGTGGPLTGFGVGTGSLNANGRLYVGGFGTTSGSVGTFAVNTTGTLAVSSDLVVGAGGTGVVSIDSGTVTTGGWNFVGRDEGLGGGNGTLRMSGGTFTNNGPRTFIGHGDSTGSMQMSGGTYNNMVIGVDTFFAIGVNNLGNATTPTLNMTGGTINSARVFTIGGNEAFGGNGDATFVGAGKGSATINGANARINSFGEFWVGQGIGSVGELTLNAGTIAVDNWIDIGRFGATGRVTMTGGTFEKSGGGHFLIGDGEGASGTLTQSGGAVAINSGELWVGQNGAVGQYDMSGGTLNVGNWTALGRTGGTGTLNFTGGTITKAGGGVFILGDPTGSGRTSTGTVNQSGATSLLSTNEIWVGQGIGGFGVYNLSAGTLTSSGWTAIGREGGIGTVNISGTGVLQKVGDAGSSLIVGSLGGNGTVNQTGGSVVVSPGAGSILLGEGSSQALWDLSGGTVSADAVVVSWNGGVNEMRVRGTGELTGGFINVGEAGGNGKGVVNQTAGTITSNSWIAVGIGSAQQAEYNLSGGTTNAAGFEVADTQGIVRISASGVLNVSGNIENPSRNGIGLFEITGGIVNAGGYQQGGRDGNVLGSGVTNQSGGVVNVSGDLVVQRPGVGTGTYNLSGGTLAVNGVIDASLGTFTFTGGELTRSGPGVLNFFGNLTTGGPGAILGLDSDKTFQINGALNSSAGLSLDLTGLGIPDQLSPLLSASTGGFALGMITVAPEPGAFNLGKVIDLWFDATFATFNGGSVTATRINEDAPFNPLADSVYWIDEDGGVISLQYSVIPEPTSAVLITAAGLILACRRRRQR